MRLLDLHIDGFGKFHDRTVRFEDGMNLVYGKNEAGKSTLHTFIRCMLFGMERDGDEQPEMICLPVLSPGRIRALTAAGFVWKKTGLFIELNEIFKKI